MLCNLLKMVEEYVIENPLSRTDSGDVDEVSTTNSKNDLFAALEEVKKKAKRDDSNRGETAETVWKEYINSVLETNKNLSWWLKYEERADSNKYKLALCRLAKKYLTPPPTSTDCERLFSVAGQIVDEKRANLLPDNLEKILFLRENILSTNFSLDW